MRFRSLQIALPLAILIELAGVGASVYGYRAIKRAAEEADENRFVGLMTSQVADITTRLDSYEAVLHGGVGILNGSQEVTAAEWERYVSSLPLDKVAPGILGVGRISPVKAADRQAALDGYEQEMGDDFDYKTVDGVPSPEDSSYIIDRIEPLSSNRLALGLDVATEKERREAYEKARDTGMPHVTGIITLVQDEQKRPGFLLMIPRYRHGVSVETVEQRRQAFMDVVYAPMISKDILSMPKQQGMREIGFAVYDGQKDEEHLIYSTDDAVDSRNPLLQRVVAWPYAGRQWLVHAWATERFSSEAANGQQMVFLIVGIGLSTLLASALWVMHRRHKQTLTVIDRVEEEVREKTGINNLFVEHAPAAIAIFDTRLHYLSTSKRWMEQYEIKGDVTGKHHYEVFPEIRNMDDWVQVHQRALAGSHERGGPDPFVRESGELQYIKWEIHPWHKADGQIGGVVMFAQDVTEEESNRIHLQEAKQELEIIQERLTQATDAGNIGIWDWHVDTGELVWNDQMYALFGLSKHQSPMTMDVFHDAIDPEDRARFDAVLKSTMDEDIDFEVEYRTVRGDRPTVLAIGKLHRSQDGAPLRMIGVCVDVSEQVTIRRELLQASENHAKARREAEKMVKARQQFLATMSHEIRTPMNGMIGMSELLLTTPLNEQQKEFAQTIIHCGQSLLALINDILDLSKIEAGAIQLDQQPFDPRELVERVMRIVEGDLHGRDIRLEHQVDQEVPAKLIGDENRLQQVLVNLLSNAVKFTHHGVVSLELRHQSGDDRHVDLVFRVVDSGVGMSEEELERVFLPFVQADASTTRRYGGTGLGLSISRSLMLLMGGSLTIESELGKGTAAIARVRLPWAKDRSTEAAEGSVRESGRLGIRLKRVLIVEDNPVNQRVTELQMKPYAEQIDIAENGQVAVDRCAENDYDLVLMDCQMPVMDGFDATRGIRADEAARGLRRRCIIALTANAFESDQLDALESGMDGFLAKPLRMEVLHAELQRLADRMSGS